MTVRGTWWINGLLLTGVATASTAAAFAMDTPATPLQPAGDVAKLHAVLTDSRATQSDREEAAKRLVSRTSSAARAQVQYDLEHGNAQSQLALTSALSSADDPDPALIPVLGRLLRSRVELTRSASAGLTNFRDRTAAFETLRNFASNATNPNQQRSEVIVAMGLIVDQTVARYLVGRLQDPMENGSIRRAATDALGEMTALDFGADSNAWLNWWSTASTWNADHFIAELQRPRDRRTNQLQSQKARLRVEATTLLKSNYVKIHDKLLEEANATLLGYLNSASPEIRIVGAQQDFSIRPPAEVIKSRLLQMVGDSDAGVRLQVIIDLATINEARAVAPLLEQLGVERDTAIRVKIAYALGKIEDTAAVPTLLKQTHDPQPEVATAAAKAIAGPLGEKLRTTDPAAAHQASTDLRGLIDSIASIASLNDVRASCMAALATLGDPDSFGTFDKYLTQPGETTDVRRAAIVGIGVLGDTGADALIAACLEDNDRYVRSDAATALMRVATPLVAEPMYNRLAKETDPEVAERLWRALFGVLKKESAKDLRGWTTRFKAYPERYREMLIAYGDALAKNDDQYNISLNNQNIAVADMNLNPPRATEAVAYLQKSIDYWRGPGAQKDDQEQNLEELVAVMTDDLLAAGRYAEAVDFAAKQIAISQPYQQTVIPRLKDKADRLINDGDVASAKVLVEGTLKIPRLGEQYVRLLEQAQQNINDKTGQH